VECEIGKVELPGNNIKKCDLTTMSDFCGSRQENKKAVDYTGMD